MNAKETESYKKHFDEFADIVEEYIDVDKVKSVYDIGAGNCRETVWLRDNLSTQQYMLLNAIPLVYVIVQKTLQILTE